jgi:Cu/Zn superoxide dismutase
MKIGRTLVLCAATLAACASSALSADVDSLTVKMTAKHGSGENGTAVLTQQPDGLHIALTVANAPDGIAQPAFIHQGTCDIMNQTPQWPLNAAVDGKSETVLPDVKLADVAGGKYAINVHKNADEATAYVSCGDIK